MKRTRTGVWFYVAWSHRDRTEGFKTERGPQVAVDLRVEAKVDVNMT